MEKFLTWLGGFFEDNQKKASRKAATLYTCLAFLGVIIIGDKSPELEILGVLVVIILWCLGAISREQVGKFVNKDPKK